MNNNLGKKYGSRKERLLYAVIIVLLLAFSTVLFIHFTTEPKVVTVYEMVKDFSNGESVPLPQEIMKSPALNDAEETLRVVREIKKTNNGRYVVTARLEGVSTLEDGIVLQDFVEDVKFLQKMDVKLGSIIAKNGTLFPPNSDLNISSYGPGPIDERSTSINIAILDINFSNQSTNTDLYEFIIEFEGEVDEMFFDGPEFRFGKYILELDKDTYEL